MHELSPRLIQNAYVKIGTGSMCLRPSTSFLLSKRAVHRACSVVLGADGIAARRRVTNHGRLPFPMAGDGVMSIGMSVSSGNLPGYFCGSFIVSLSALRIIETRPLFDTGCNQLKATSHGKLQPAHNHDGLQSTTNLSQRRPTRRSRGGIVETTKLTFTRSVGPLPPGACHKIPAA